MTSVLTLTARLPELFWRGLGCAGEDVNKVGSDFELCSASSANEFHVDSDADDDHHGDRQARQRERRR